MVSPNQKTAFLQDRKQVVEMNAWIRLQHNIPTTVLEPPYRAWSKKTHGNVTNIETNVDLLICG